MIGKISTFFPLSVYSVRGGLDVDTRQAIVEDIDKCSTVSAENGDGAAWTGDVNGFHQVHNNPLYAPVFNAVGIAIREYLPAIGVSDTAFDYFYIRSWGVRQTGDQTVKYHNHGDAHLSVVYYPKVPEGSGKLQLFNHDPPNMLFSGMFNEEQYADGTLDSKNPQCRDHHSLTVDDDLLVIFPSKTYHRTTENESDQPRYSVTADVVLVLKSADKKEYGLPPLSVWRKA